MIVIIINLTIIIMRINSHLSFIRHHMRTVRGEFIEIITQDHYQLVTTPPSIFGLIDGEAYMGAASIYRSAIESLVRLTRVDDAKKYKSGTAVEYPGVSEIRLDRV